MAHVPRYTFHDSRHTSHVTRFTFQISCLLFFILVCSGQADRLPVKELARPGLTVVTTLFPLYDFTREIGGDKVQVTMLVPPGVEPHSFEPNPATILLLNKARVLVYTGNAMEPWMEKILSSVENKGLVVVDSSVWAGTGTKHVAHSTIQHEDPHIWLDLGRAQKMVDTIYAGLRQADPDNAAYYKKNASAYKERLGELDHQFKKELARCPKKIFIEGGHYAFGHLASRYKLRYVAAYGLSPNTEPDPQKLSEIVELIRQNHLNYIFYEELLSPRVAEILARETGVKLLELNAGHNLTRDEFRAGKTFIGLMRGNLQNLVRGLQ
jgi:zinc transport system substrate-binding protein